MKLELQRLRYAVSDFSLDVDARFEEASVIAIFGGSGAGKTSLLELIAGIRAPSHGGISIDSRKFVDEGRVVEPARSRRVGYVPQDALLFPHLSVRENVVFGRRENGGITFEQVIEVLELGHVEDRSVQHLSGGERRRVALARALVSSPRTLLLDEPLAGLEHSLQDRILQYLLRIRDEFRVPMIYVTHEPEEVMTLCSHALVLQRGSMMRCGTVVEIFEKRSVDTWMLRGAQFATE